MTYFLDQNVSQLFCNRLATLGSSCSSFSLPTFIFLSQSLKVFHITALKSPFLAFLWNYRYRSSRYQAVELCDAVGLYKGTTCCTSSFLHLFIPSHYYVYCSHLAHGDRIFHFFSPFLHRNTRCS